MNIAAIKKFDIANGPGVRVSLFVSGCRHRCKNCFNREAWDFDYGTPFTEATADELCRALAPGYITGLSVLGGEPFEPENRPDLVALLTRVRKEYPQKDIWCYTGFDFERELLPGNSKRLGDPATTRALLECIDVLVDGRFVEELKSPALIFRGSSNQRIIDLPASLAAGRALPLPGKWERAMGSGDINE